MLAGKPSRGFLRELALFTCVAALGVLAQAFIADRSATWNGGCGDDGAFYCAMARGVTVLRPWSRRILLPALAHLGSTLTGASLPRSFEGLNLAALAAISAALFVLTRRVARALGAEDERAEWASLMAATLVWLFPMGLRWTAFCPVMVDPLAVAFALGWLVAGTSTGNAARWAGVPLAALAVLTREAWAFSIVAMSLAQASTDRSIRQSLHALATVAACFVAFVFAMSRPGLPNSFVDALPAYVGVNFREFVLSAVGRGQLAWLVLFSLGLVPLLALTGVWRQRALWTQRHALAWLLPLSLGAAVHFGEFLGGRDFHRFLFGSAPFLTVLASVSVALVPAAELEAAVVIFASLMVWRPWLTLDGSREQYFRFFSPHYLSEPAMAQRIAGDWPVAAVAAALLVLLYGWRWRRRPRPTVPRR